MTTAALLHEVDYHRGGTLMRMALSIILILLSAARVDGAYAEAPLLAARSASGELPPVTQRLPAEPVIVTPVERLGTYGGSWRMLITSARDLQLTHRLGYETLMRWDRDGVSIVPGIAESLEVRDDARTFVFKLRKGMKWSDGHPFTSEDFVFFRKYVRGNNILSPGGGSTMWKVDDKTFDVEAPDPYTVIIRYEKPYGLFLQTIAHQGRQGEIFTPAHYSKRFHPDFTRMAEVEKNAAAAGYNDWAAYYAFMHNLDQSPACPSVGPFVVTVPYPAQRCVATRNPYYWKIDPAGQQLPYIDHIVYDRVLDLTMLNLRVLDGQIDFQNRGIDAANFTLLMEAAKAREYRVQVDYATGSTGVFVNQFSRDEVKRPILQDRRFRVALSIAQNRLELIEVIYNGLGKADNGVSMPRDPYYVPGSDQTYVEFDPTEANRLLDELGLERGAGGMRRWPDGRAFREILHVFPAENGTNAELWQLIAEYWRDVGLQFSVVMEDAALSRLQVMNGNSDFWAYRNLSQHWAIDGSFKIPVADYCYHAPLFGKYVMTQGRRGEKPNDAQQRLVDWYSRMRSTPDPQQQVEFGQKIVRQWSEDIYFIGIVRPIELTVISDRFHNVPAEIQYNYRLMSPGYIGIEQFFIDESK